MEKLVRKPLEAMCKPLQIVSLGDGCNTPYIVTISGQAIRRWDKINYFMVTALDAYF
jgi:hypothetical protein